MALKSSHVQPQRLARRRPRSLAGWAFVSGYVVLLIAFGVLPAGYAIYLALCKSTGEGFAGFANFIQTAEDYRFLPAIGHVALYLVIWLVLLVVAVVGLALAVHGRIRRVSTVFRFLYYLPGALAGVASALLWLFMLDPAVSPVAIVLKAFGYSTFENVIAPTHLPVVFALMALWTGAGGWILIMYGALNNISADVIEAAAIDGCSGWRLALHVKIPLVRKWIAYMMILTFATGTQLFIEPQLVSQASLGLISPTWSPNQLAYAYAFQTDNFNGASAISLDLLIVGLICATVIITTTGLFRSE